MPDSLRTLLRPLTCILAVGLVAGELVAQDAHTLLMRSTPTLLVGDSIAPMSSPFAIPDRIDIVVDRSVSGMQARGAGRSRARGARRGFLIGAAGGVLLGLAITNDFMDEPMVNAAAGAGFFGLIGAGIGAIVGMAPAAPPPGSDPAARGAGTGTFR